MSIGSNQGEPKNEADSGGGKTNCWQHVRAIGCCFVNSGRKACCWLVRSFGNPNNLPAFLIALFTLLLVFFAYYAWTESQKGTIALQEQITAIRASQRPWISFGVDTTPLKEGVQFKARVGFTNVGHSAALNFHSVVTPYSIQKDEADPSPMLKMPEPPLGKNVSYGILLPGPPSFTAVSWGIESGVTKADIETIKNGTVHLWLIGRSEYLDGDGKPHFTMFRGVFDPSVNAFVATREGTDAN